MFKQMICLKDIASIYGNKVSFISDIIKMRQSQKSIQTSLQNYSDHVAIKRFILQIFAQLISIDLQCTLEVEEKF